MNNTLSTPPGFKTGIVAVIGRPNVGKSTLINQIVGQKVVIVSDCPQTTRNRIVCIADTDRYQMVFLDTPGIHKPHDELNAFMVRQATQSLHEVDVAVFLLEAHRVIGKGDRFVAQVLEESGVPTIAVLNKIDRVSPEQLQPAWETLLQIGKFKDQIAISALQSHGVAELVTKICELLPEGPRLYPAENLTDRTERFVIAELIREQAFHRLREELPHATAVVVDAVKERGDRPIYVEATIFVEHDSQKGIVIGAQGTMLKKIGAAARREIETLLAHPVYLDLHVKVRKNWRKNTADLKRFGYQS